MIFQGRKQGGGIRFGEMERDALIAHGTSFLLQDRLMNCSDYSTAWVCRTCGSIISLGYDEVSLGIKVEAGFSGTKGPSGEYCRICRVENAGQRSSDDTLPQPQTHVTLSYPKQSVVEKYRERGDLDVIAVPFVFRYLCAELASMGIAVTLEVR